MELIIFFISIFILSSINLSTQYLSNYKNLEFNKNEHLGSSYIWKNHSKFAGLTIFFGDSVIKGFFPVFLSKYILNINNEYIFLYILIIQMIGNNWSIFLKLKGGRGMAIAIGSLLGINFVLALILYGTYLLLYFSKFKDGGITWIISSNYCCNYINKFLVKCTLLLSRLYIFDNIKKSILEISLNLI